MSGGSQPSDTTQTIQPWSGAEPYLLDAFAQMSGIKIPQYYPSSTVAPQSQTTLQGQTAMANSAGTQQQASDLAQQGFDFSMTQMLDPNSNEYLQSTAEAAIKPVMETLQQDILPGIGQNAVQVGGYGGTAHANLEQNAIEDATRAALDTTSQIYSDAYTSSLDNYTKALLGVPVIQSAATAPGATQTMVGGMEDAYTQAVLSDDVARHSFDQTAEFDYLQQYIATLLGVPMGSQTVAQGGSTSPLQTGIGAGAATYALTSNPYLAVPAAIGGYIYDS